MPDSRARRMTGIACFMRPVVRRIPSPPRPMIVGCNPVVPNGRVGKAVGAASAKFESAAPPLIFIHSTPSDSSAPHVNPRRNKTRRVSRRPHITGALWLLRRMKRQRRGVDAVALARRLRAVVEHVPEMRVAARAEHFGSTHKEGGVGGIVNVALIDRHKETRPSGAGVELGLGTIQVDPAAHAPIHPGVMMIPVRAGKRPFGAFPARHAVLLRRQLGLQLLVGFAHLFHEDDLSGLSVDDGDLLIVCPRTTQHEEPSRCDQAGPPSGGPHQKRPWTPPKTSVSPPSRCKRRKSCASSRNDRLNVTAIPSGSPRRLINCTDTAWRVDQMYVPLHVSARSRPSVYGISNDTDKSRLSFHAPNNVTRCLTSRPPERRIPTW